MTRWVEMYYDGQLLEMGSSMVLVGITLFYVCLLELHDTTKKDFKWQNKLHSSYFAVYLIGTGLAVFFKNSVVLFFGILAIQSV